MKPFIILPALLGVAYNAPRPQVNTELFAKEIAKNGFIEEDSRIKAESDLNSPAAAAALAYMKEAQTDAICSKATTTYIESILDGQSREAATAAASRAYITAYNAGARHVPGSACQAAGVAWKEAFISGTDPITKATNAFFDTWPGVKDGNPCAVAGGEYLNALLKGKSHLEAGTAGTKGFSKAFKDMARKGKSLKDPACLAASKAYMEAIPKSSQPDAARSAAFTAFVNKMFQKNASPFDPVCLGALDSYIEAYSSGDDEETANLKAAKSFYDAMQSGASIPADSPCTAATLAYAKELGQKQSPSAHAAMMAYISESLEKGTSKIDPVCAAASNAYWDAYLEKKDEGLASEAAAIAYVEALDKATNFDPSGACAKAAEAYIEEFSL